MKFELYGVATDEASAFNSGDVLFRSEQVSDNQLYRQVTNDKNEVVAFLAYDVEAYRRLYYRSDFRKCVASVRSGILSTGEMAVFCFADFESQSCIFFFSETETPSHGDCFSYLKSLNQLRNCGAIIEFLFRIAPKGIVGRYVREVIIAQRDRRFSRHAIYLFLCADGNLKSRDLIAYYKYSEVLAKDGEELRLNLPDSLLGDTKSRLFAALKYVLRPREMFNSEDISRDTQSNLSEQVVFNTSLNRPSNALKSRAFSGDDLRKLRIRLGYGRSELGRVIGVSADRIRRWETKNLESELNFHSPTLDHLKLMGRDHKAADGVWYLVAGKSRKRQASRMLRFLENRKTTDFAIEFSIAADAYSLVLVNPYSQFFLDLSARRKLAELPAELDNPSEGNFGFRHVRFLSGREFEVRKYLIGSSSNQDSIRIVGVDIDYASHKEEFEQLFLVIFGNVSIDQPDNAIQVDNLMGVVAKLNAARFVAYQRRKKSS